MVLANASPSQRGPEAEPQIPGVAGSRWAPGVAGKLSWESVEAHTAAGERGASRGRGIAQGLSGPPLPGGAKGSWLCAPCMAVATLSCLHIWDSAARQPGTSDVPGAARGRLIPPAAPPRRCPNSLPEAPLGGF